MASATLRSIMTREIVAIDSMKPTTSPARLVPDAVISYLGIGGALSLDALLPQPEIYAFTLYC